MRRKTYELTNWSFVQGKPDPYLAPEVPNLALHGQVHGHARFEEGDWVTTSRIIEWDGRSIKTLRSTYVLTGDPDPDFVTYLADLGKDWDWDDPVGTCR